MEKLSYNRDVVIPNYSSLGEKVTEVGDRAFLGDFKTRSNPEVGIRSLYIPDSVVSIGHESFRYNSLLSVRLSNRLRRIGNLAFNGNLIEELILPNTLIDLGVGAFTDNQISSLLLSPLMKIIPASFAFNRLQRVDIPKEVVRICDYAFSDNLIEELELPESLKYLSGFNNNKLRQIDIPSSVSTLGKKALARNNMAYIKIPSNVKVIGESAFWNTWHDVFLEGLVIEEGVEEIHKYAFSGNKLRDVKLPKSLRKLDSKAFYNNTPLDGLAGIDTPHEKLVLVGNISPIVLSEPIKKSKLLERLQSTTVALDRLGNQTNVELYWNLDTCPNTIFEDMVILGTFLQKDGRSCPENSVKCSIVFESKPDYENLVSWTVDDFIYSNTTLMGFSEKGQTKLHKSKSVSIPSVNHIGEPISNVAKNAFRNCGIRHLSLDGIFKGLSVGESSFRENDIETLSLAKGIVSIDTYAFFQNKLVTVEFPSSLKKVGNHAFAKNKLYSTNFHMKSTGLSLDGFSFYENNLYRLELPSSICKVHKDAFKGNNIVHIFTPPISNPDKNRWFTHSKHHKIISSKFI